MWIVLVAVLVFVALVAGAPRNKGRDLDPDGTGPSGLKALRELATSFGARVEVTSNMAPDADVMFMAQDIVPDADIPTVEDWVSRGGVLVVTDPSSPFAPAGSNASGLLAGSIDDTIPRGECDVRALAAVDRLATGGGGVRYQVSSGSESCFGADGRAFVVVTSEGSGAIVAIGGPGPFVNRYLGDQDNAALAVSLLAPRPGTRVAMLVPGAGAVADRRSLTDALSPGVRLALLQLFVAFGVYAWFRGRRLGQPIVEAQPVQIEGSELVSAVGALMQQTRDPTRAAALMRADLRRRLVARLGLASDVEPRVMAEVAAARTGVDPERIRVAVEDSFVTSDAELLTLAQYIDSIRKEILHGPR